MPSARPTGLRRLIHACALLLLVGSFEARAEIYRWTDAQGRLHFSQSLESVPPGHRAEALRAARAPKGPDPLQVYSSPSSAGPAMRARALGVTPRSSGTMRIPFERRGTLMKVDVRLNRRVVAPFYIDTGASGISIPWAVAQQLGIRIGPDTPRGMARTANGIISEPLVTLDSVQLGPAVVRNVTAAVSGTMNIGLLGGAFFNNFIYQVDSAAGVITLTPNHRVRAGLDQQQWVARFEAIREPLARVDAYIEKGGFMDKGRVRELEAHREQLRAALRVLERKANSAGVPRGWRE